MISCVMLSGGPGRLPWRAEAVDCWLNQTGVQKELLVVSELPVLSPLANVRWVHREPGMSIGEQRNRAARAAFGTFITHWDDDDWSAPSRLRRQRYAFRQAKVMACGFNTALFFDVRTCEVWRYQGDPVYAIGSSLMYRRNWILEHPFENRNIGEDGQLVRQARHEAGLVVLDNPNLLVCRTHPECVTKRDHRLIPAGPQWQPAQREDLPSAFPVDTRSRTTAH